MKKSVKIVSIVVVLIAMLFIAAAVGIGPLSELTYTSDAAYPLLIAVLSLIFAVWIVFDERAKAKKEADAPDDKSFNRDVLVTIGLMLLYAVLLIWLGYIISTLVFTTLAVTYLYRGGWKLGLLIGFMATFIIVLVFKYGFNVILP